MKTVTQLVSVNSQQVLLTKIKALFTVVLFFLCSVNLMGQNRIFNSIAEAKSFGSDFNDVRVFETTGQQFSRSNIFIDPSAVPILNYVLEPATIKESTLSFEILIEGKAEVIDLIEVPDKFYEFNITTDTGEKFSIDRNNNKHFRGVIRGQPNSLVAISFFENDVKGIIANDSGNYNISKLNGSNNIIIFNESNLIPTSEFVCEVANDNFEGYDKSILLREENTRSLFETNCVRFYFETEYDIYQYFGNTPAVINYVTAIYNQVAIIYQNEGIDTTVSDIFVWTTPDPYTATSTGSLLSQFQSNTGAFNGDLGQLLTFRPMGGQAAGFNGICNPDTDMSLSVSGGLSPTVVNFPVYSWNVMVVAHEFGHLFGSRHTHACVWNGNNTAIDGCSGFTEGGCPVPGSPPGGGTIMSYCHFTVGINFNNGFGLQPGNVIRDRVANGSCLGTCSPCPPSPTAFDLFSKDRPIDTGNEPNMDPSPMWISEDIWIRKDMDGGTVHQNPEFKMYSPNGVYVKIRNRSTVTSSCAVLKVYFSKASAGLQWPVHFDNYYQNVGSTSVLHGDIIATATIPPIAPNGTITIELPWYPPNPADYANDIHHFCLVSRIISPNDPMANEMTGGVGFNARENNNIAWKNVSVYNVDPSGLAPPTSVFVRGINKRSDLTNIRFLDRGFNDEVTYKFFDIGHLVLNIEPRLFERMLRNGSLDGPGIRIEGDNTVIITSAEAVIKNFSLKYGETFSLNFNFFVREELQESDLVLVDLIQENAETKTYNGGERFLITQSKKDKKLQPTDLVSASFDIIPNSNNGKFVIKLTNIKKGYYTIVDIFGRTLLQNDFNSDQDIKVDISNMPSNIYYVRVTSGDLTLNKTLVKN